MNLSDLVRDAAMANPAKAAFVFQGRAMTFGELEDLVDLTAAAFTRFGIERGDRVALLVGNVPEFVSSLYAVLRIGAIACPLNVMLTPEELGYILADAGAKAVVSELPSLPGLLSVRDRLADLRTVFVIGGPPAPAGTVSLEEALSDEAEPPSVETDESDVAVIAYTAGTTAEPKGAVLSHGNLMANLVQMSSVSSLLAIEPDDLVLTALPLFHIYALNVVLGMSFQSGATAILAERFDPVESIKLIARHRITVLIGAPPMFAGWLAASGSPDDLSSVRMAVSGASPLPPEVLDAFLRRFGVIIWEGYGLTECAPAVTSNALGPQAKAGSIGLPMPGLELRVVDEDGEEVEEGDPGEILVRGPNVFSGYWNRPQETGTGCTLATWPTATRRATSSWSTGRRTSSSSQGSTSSRRRSRTRSVGTRASRRRRWSGSRTNAPVRPSRPGWCRRRARASSRRRSSTSSTGTSRGSSGRGRSASSRSCPTT